MSNPSSPFDNLSIDLLAGTTTSDTTSPGSLPPTPPIDLLGGLGDMAPGQVTIDNEAVNRYMETIGRRTDTPPRREFLVRSDDPSHPNDWVLFIDNSTLEVFNTCNRRAYYYAVRAREGAGISSALTFGGAVHSALEQRYKRGLKHVDATTQVELLNGEKVLLSSLQDAFIERYMAGITFHEQDHRTPSRAKNVIAAYNEQYAIEPFDLIETRHGDPICELGFAVPFATIPVNRTIKSLDGVGAFVCDNIHVVYTGRIDLPVLWDNVPTIIDHKTTLMLGATFADQFRLSPQMLGYCWAANSIPELRDLVGGRTFQSLCVNAICVRPITRTGVPTEFVRNRYFYDQSHIDEWKLDTLALVSEFINNFLVGYFPKKANWCIGKYGACPYLNVCAMPVGQQREVMLQSEMYRDVTWNPLDER